MQPSLCLLILLPVLPRLTSSAPTPSPNPDPNPAGLKSLKADLGRTSDSSNSDGDDDGNGITSISSSSSSEFAAISTALTTTSCFSPTSSSHRVRQMWAEDLGKAKELAEDACSDGKLVRSSSSATAAAAYKPREERRVCFQLSGEKRVEFRVKLDSAVKKVSKKGKKLDGMDCRYNLWKAVSGCEMGGRRRDGGFEYLCRENTTLYFVVAAAATTAGRFIVVNWGELDEEKSATVPE
ncbi:hypothetical protein QBC43DRAFT_365952 [Cladorrhinum sp. PSN259]|nr:hypothetical protein QBC43DRAFT_365952 [Cladorrhinum sp. PSN259]